MQSTDQQERGIISEREGRDRKAERYMKYSNNVKKKKLSMHADAIHDIDLTTPHTPSRC
jgi:hypothetical protein